LRRGLSPPISTGNYAYGYGGKMYAMVIFRGRASVQGGISVMGECLTFCGDHSIMEWWSNAIY